MFNHLPIKKNKLFFFSYYGSQYGCNPKYITEYISSHYPDKTFDIVWAFNDINTRDQQSHMRQVKVMSLRYFYELCTSKVIITNYRTTDLFIKRKEQYYIQTWHSSLRLKQIEKDAEEMLPLNYIKMAQKDSLKCDLLLSGCRYSTNIFKRNFWYAGEIFEHGTPRNDLLFQRDHSKREFIIENLSLDPSTKVLLYAPTFRENDDLEVYDIDYPKLIEALKHRFGGQWTILVKLHPHLIAKADQIIHGRHVKNVTAYDDVQELMFIADVLITDYSSLMFDFAITGRPCFLYVPDLQVYTNVDRNLYFKVEDLPFIQTISNDDLLKKVAQYNGKAYKENLAGFLKQIDSYEQGRASEYLLQKIHGICFNHEEDGRREAV